MIERSIKNKSTCFQPSLDLTLLLHLVSILFCDVSLNPNFPSYFNLGWSQKKAKSQNDEKCHFWKSLICYSIHRFRVSISLSKKGFFIFNAIRKWILVFPVFLFFSNPNFIHSHSFSIFGFSDFFRSLKKTKNE